MATPPITSISYPPTFEVAIADELTVGAVVKFVVVSPFLKPAYAIVKAGFTSPYSLDLSSAVAVKVALFMVSTILFSVAK